MNNSKETILAIINNSSLSEEQKNIWQGFLENLDEQLAAPIAETIQDDDSALRLLTENIQDKLEALASENPDAWKNVIQKEKEILEKVEE